MDEQSQVAPAKSTKASNKKFIILVIIFILLIILVSVGTFLYTNNMNTGTDKGGNEAQIEEDIRTIAEPTRTPSSKIIYSCAEDKSIEASFFNEGDFSSVDLVMSDGTSVLLYKVDSQTGDKYANADESMVFWDRNGEIYLEDHGEETFSDCVENS